MKKNFLWGVGLTVFCLSVFQSGISAQDTDMEFMCKSMYDTQVDIAGIQYTLCHNLCNKLWSQDAVKKESCLGTCQKQYEKDLKNADNAYERCKAAAGGGGSSGPGWDTTPNQ